MGDELPWQTIREGHWTPDRIAQATAALEKFGLVPEGHDVTLKNNVITTNLLDPHQDAQVSIGHDGDEFWAFFPHLRDTVDAFHRGMASGAVAVSLFRRNT